MSTWLVFGIQVLLLGTSVSRLSPMSMSCLGCLLIARDFRTTVGQHSPGMGSNSMLVKAESSFVPLEGENLWMLEVLPELMPESLSERMSE